MFRAKTTSSFASKIAHTSTIPALGNKDLKLLQDLITNEKAILITLQKLAVDFTRASESLKNWGLGEGEDLGDILSQATNIYSHISTAFNNFATHEHTVRDHLKSIRTREEKLDELKRKRKSVASKADAADKKLSKMSGENKNLPAQTELLSRLRDEIRGLDTEIMVEEARLGDFKRLSTRNFMALKLGGLLEFGEKATIVGELGKLLIEEIPLEPTPPGQPRAFYQSHSKTENLTSEVSRCIGEVVFAAPVGNNAEDFHTYQLPPTGMAGEEGLGGPFEYVRTHADGGLPSPTTELRGTSMSMMSTSGPQNEPPLNEFGESAYRRFGSGPMRTSDDGPHIGAGGGGGQFSTFPVKARSGTEASLGLGGESFSASVANAMRSDEGEGADNERNERRESVKSSQPPSVTVGGNIWSGDEFGTSHSQNETQDNSQLPYMQQPEDQHVESGDARGIQREVRFRTPSMETSSMGQPGGASPMYPSSGAGSGRGHNMNASSYDAPHSPIRSDMREDKHNFDPPPPDYAQAPIPLDEEYARNSAAAREVAREMDTLHFAPPQQPQPYQPQQTSLQSTQPLQITRTPSPLSPPTAPFAQPRSVSPTPGIGSLAMPQPEVSRYVPGRVSPILSDSTTPQSPSQNSPTVGGPRTISAAAFKRVGRMGSDPDITKKRPLPTSPYPSRPGGSGLALQDAGASYARSGQLPPGAQAPDLPEPRSGSPVMSDYGVLGNVRVTNVDSGQASGYSQSRFVTNLED